jgi:hypothetical protein
MEPIRLHSSILEATAMSSCALCGAPLPGTDAACIYDVPLDRAPGIGEPSRIAAGKQSHADHEVHIARWRVHHPGEWGASPKVMAWARERLAREGHVVPGREA